MRRWLKLRQLVQLALLRKTVSASATYPECIEEGIVYRHAGAHGIFVDLNFFGSTGCWQNDCRSTDKFHSDDVGICARACWQIQECTHWSFGEGSCFLRKSEGGMESAGSFASGPKACAPPPLPDAWLARQVAKLPALDCENGTCDMVCTATTWRFAISALQRVAIDNIRALVHQIATDTDTFIRQRHEEIFLDVVKNNRLVFEAVDGWLALQPEPTQLKYALPLPILGELCGPSSCY
ncbi:unnamed protein product [Durusdinium trenchii]|uniref:Uncharacterized protein n=2 Tax=Durusdinium trenchii TaxID=1381693 RepID=A0ABP0M5P6_9DINO